jgi:hypothetical protein
MPHTYVTLFDVLVPVPALSLLLDLERRDFHVRADPDHDSLWVTPLAALTTTDLDNVRRYKHHLIHLVSHCDPPDRTPVPSPLPESVQWRLDGMQATHGQVPFPCAVLEACGGPGRCASCGQPIPAATYGRCRSCATAAGVFRQVRRGQRHIGEL